jgi:hypothetical protein
MFLSWFFKGIKRGKAPVRAENFRPRLEGLEERAVPSTTTVTPPGATHFELLGPSRAIAGKSEEIRVVALDASNHRVPGYTGTVTLTSTGTGDSTPSTYAFKAGDHGRHDFKVTFGSAGSDSITATDNSTTPLTGTETIQVQAAPVVTHFLLQTHENIQGGVQTTVRVLALDASNHPVNNYTGTVTLTSTGTGDSTPSTYAFKAGDHGQHLFQVTFANTGTTTISDTVTATDNATTPNTGSVTVQVSPAPVATHFLVVSPRHVEAGVSVPVSVVALDASNHRVPNYTGTVTLTSTGTGDSTPSTYAFKAGDHGQHIFDVTLANTGSAAISDTITATDNSTTPITGTETVQVNPAPVATHFGILVFPFVQAGQSTSVLVVALDAHNHIVANYTGTVTLTSTGTGDSTPSTYSFQAGDHGLHIFDVTFANTGSDTLTATDTSATPLTGTRTVHVAASFGGHHG